MNRTQHWTLYLPEGRRIFRDEAQAIALLIERNQEAQKQLYQLREQLQKQESYVLELAKAKGYNEEEIAQAIKDSKKD